MGLRRRNRYPPDSGGRRVAHPTRLWFLRHGEVESPWVGRFIGTSDVALSSLGRHQGEAIRAYLEDAPVDAIVSSPRRRALETIAPLAKAKGMKIDVRKPFGEMDYGEWEGLDWEQILARDREFAQKWQADPATLCPPGGESCDLFQQRVSSGVEALADEFRGRSIVLAGHAGTNRAILGHVLRRPFMECFAFAQDYGCLNAVGWSQDVPGFGQVALVNFVPGPRAVHQGE